jgi:protein-S-isoprenylcysteine O-methyltransferase Ste14
MTAGVMFETVGALSDAVTGGGLRSWLDVVHTALKAGLIFAFTILVVKRGPARRRERSLVAYTVCAAAMLTGALEPPPASTGTAFVISGEVIAVLGGAWMIHATLALGRCFGVLPEARGLVTHGPYKRVRHPLYLGEFALCGGLVIASPSLLNVVLASVFAAAQLQRMRMEERELTAQFPEYADYARRTRRLIPMLQPEGGQALVEYAAITGLVSIAGFLLLNLIGGFVNVSFSQIAGGF